MAKPQTIDLEIEGMTCTACARRVEKSLNKVPGVSAFEGTQVDLIVMRARAAELLSLMPEKQAPDMSKFLLSPMPGLLREVAVTVGQEVKAGEKLAVIEAMKMENILKAEQDGKVKKISAAAGESLSVDQIIIEFE